MKSPSAVLAFLVALAATSCGLEPVAASRTVVLQNDKGGLVAEYEYRFTAQARRGDRAVIAGGCLSACTMSIGIFKGRICALPSAVLGFHSAWVPTRWGHAYSSEGTEHMTRWYTPETMAWIETHGGLTPNMIFLRAPEIYQVVPACNKTK